MTCENKLNKQQNFQAPKTVVYRMEQIAGNKKNKLKTTMFPCGITFLFSFSFK